MCILTDEYSVDMSADSVSQLSILSVDHSLKEFVIARV